MSANSPAAMRYNRSITSRRCHRINTNMINVSAEKESINIETKTITRYINIKWSINKQTIDIAKLSSKGEKKGVIETSVQHKQYTFNLELCVPGWRRSQDGFSAFYLTVPREKIAISTNKNSRRRLSTDDAINNSINNNNNALIDNENEDNQSQQQQQQQHIHRNNTEDVNRNNNNNNNHNNDNDGSDDENNDFVARYTVTFGRGHDKLTRKSSVRNDFDLGVGFPNFTEVATLSNAIYENILEFDIEVEVFECESTIKNCPYLDNYYLKQNENAKGITSKLVEKMYYEKLNCDAAIIANYVNVNGIKKRKCIKVHKCILTAASPVMEYYLNINRQKT